MAAVASPMPLPTSTTSGALRPKALRGSSGLPGSTPKRREQPVEGLGLPGRDASAHLVGADRGREALVHLSMVPAGARSPD